MSALRKWERISCILFFVSDVCLVLFKFADFNCTGIKRYISYTLPSVFWISLLGALLIQIVIYVKIKNASQIKQNKKIGILTFGSSKAAMIVDVTTLILFVLLVIVLILKNSSVFAFTIIGTFIFSFEMHCIINGKIFRYLFLGGK